MREEIIVRCFFWNKRERVFTIFGSLGNAKVTNYIFIINTPYDCYAGIEKERVNKNKKVHGKMRDFLMICDHYNMLFITTFDSQ